MKNKKIKLLVIGILLSSFFTVHAQTNKLPEIKFISPSNGATFNVGNAITLNISASDSDGTVDLVTLFQGNAGGTVIKTFDNPPYTYIVSQTTPGNYIYSAQAFDNIGGMKATSITIKIIEMPPTPTPIDSNTGLVPCDGSAENPCGFDQFLTLINTIVNFILFVMVVPIAAIIFAYAGFELITSGGETSKREKAKKIFTNVAIGLIVAAAAFLIVKTVLSIVGYTGTPFLK
ncbi:MAG: Peptidase domain protein [Candidatus Nomurabacteria bacterium GW2011_GWF2_35_12]|uniref:Peptidase domain protein n=3 Tax=Candidatus Nomuraibacteriota TaxID=1752729 RepID=A0A0G0GF54_9BACT|nr:MAG: Peptidase domain protein [Candidatus Nomurabacteria bacterium GW2011_GWF2_35_12]KKP72417.1 MAG: Peptidase domain protein [Candidatus Nomurabacteria bacterium GW2011_GWB1_35_20]KKP75127.1 MAG: Peptidase domain protein [Parcubacteria group bacterium GW2011_GWC1_35_21]KKP78248.1 MAG: Peptidase domain protein [Candidatus Nomurabacteria bacterium GW2011_GWC2_35_35]KKP85346.1 MAG: Peptidase domain protein [Parcubacteria group bacterium GW2011_GWD2_35_7]KKP88144.1 MAG: Peptidase domain protei